MTIKTEDVADAILVCGQAAIFCQLAGERGQPMIDRLLAASDTIERLREENAWRDAKSDPPPKTANLTRASQCFLAWCPDEDAPDGGDQRIVWWEPVMNGGCWFGDRDLVEKFTHWKPLGPSPRAALTPSGDDPSKR